MQDIAPGATIKAVIACASPHPISATASKQCIFVPLPIDQIVAALTIEDIQPPPSDDSIRPASGVDRIGRPATIKTVGARVPDQEVGVPGSGEVFDPNIGVACSPAEIAGRRRQAGKNPYVIRPERESAGGIEVAHGIGVPSTEEGL